MALYPGQAECRDLEDGRGGRSIMQGALFGFAQRLSRIFRQRWEEASVE